MRAAALLAVTAAIVLQLYLAVPPPLLRFLPKASCEPCHTCSRCDLDRWLDR